MTIYNKLTIALENKKVRSAWDKGVILYAMDFVDFMEENETESFSSFLDAKSFLLNGAQNWDEYSWGGSSLIYDWEIAKRLCTPSELRKTGNGTRKPNKDEEWLDTQARALFQATYFFWEAYCEVTGRCFSHCFYEED